MKRLAVIVAGGTFLFAVLFAAIIGAVSGSAQCAPAPGQQQVPLSGGDRAEQVFRFFTGHGVTDIGAAGIVGTFQKESGFSTTVPNGQGSGATGLGQWLGNRLAKLQAKPNWTDLQVQLDYAWEELSGGYRSVLREIQHARTTEEAAVLFNQHYEIPGPGVGDAAAAAGAKAALARFGGGDGGGTSDAALSLPATPGCTTLSATGMASLDEAVQLDHPRSFTPLPSWAMAAGRAPEEVDTRILQDVLWVLRHYGLRVTAARETGHQTHGDGTAVDLVPANGNDQAAWDQSALALAHDLGWTEGCAANGVAPVCSLKPAIRGVFYNGYPGHGDPAHVGGNAHIHVSWMATFFGASGLAPPNDWVRVFPVPAPGSSDSAAAASAGHATFTMVGDSLAVGTRDLLPAALPGWHVRTDAKVGRHLAEGMAHVRALPGTPDVLAISLGTNDSPGDLGAVRAAIRQSLAAARCVVWATISRPAVGGVSYAATNRLIERQQSGRFRVVSWAAEVADNPQLLSGDRVHPTAGGYRLRARMYAMQAGECS